MYFEECIFKQQIIIHDDGTLFIIFNCNFQVFSLFFLYRDPGGKR